MRSPSDRTAPTGRPALTPADMTDRRFSAPEHPEPIRWSAAFVLSQRQADGDRPAGRWTVVDHYHGAADGGEVRYPGMSPLDAMQASAAPRQRYAERLAESGGPVVLFVAVPVEEMAAHGITVKAPPKRR